MKNQKITLQGDGPILSGSIFISYLKCGKKNCQCFENPAKRHKIYQWSGNIQGKNTTRTLDETMYLECRKRIANYKKLKARFDKEIGNALKNAPWESKLIKNRS